MRGDQEEVLDPDSLLHLGADGFRRLPRGSAPKVKADNGNALPVGGEHQGAGTQWVQDAGARLIVTSAIAPHGVSGWWGDVHGGDARLQVLGGSRRNTD